MKNSPHWRNPIYRFWVYLMKICWSYLLVILIILLPPNGGLKWTLFKITGLIFFWVGEALHETYKSYKA